MRSVRYLVIAVSLLRSFAIPLAIGLATAACGGTVDVPDCSANTKVISGSTTVVFADASDAPDFPVTPVDACPSDSSGAPSRLGYWANGRPGESQCGYCFYNVLAAVGYDAATCIKFPYCRDETGRASEYLECNYSKVVQEPCAL